MKLIILHVAMVLCWLLIVLGYKPYCIKTIEVMPKTTHKSIAVDLSYQDKWQVQKWKIRKRGLVKKSETF